MMGPSLVAAIALLLLAPPALADLAPGGGSSRTDCLVVFDAPVNQPEKKPRNVRCADGDPACDADATINGVCVFPVAVGVNSTFNEPKCTLVGVDEIVVRHAIDDPDDPKFDPDFQALQAAIDDLDLPNSNPDEFTGFVNITVPIRGPIKKKNGLNQCRKGRKKLRLDAESVPVFSKISKDRDRLRLTCDPNPGPGGCDPQTLFSGTFDRIQRQIFDQRCATSGCHDSESFAESGTLLLETGASYGNLIDVVPFNDAAQNAGWLRVNQIDPTTGDPETSYLVRKLDDDFPGTGFGDRMPLTGKKLDSSLRDVVTLWVAAGAPESGWVLGTD